MTLEQPLSGLVSKNLEQRLIELVDGKNFVIKIEKRSKRSQYINEIVNNNDLNARVWDSEHRFSYIAAINSALVREADELMIINNTRLCKNKIKSKISRAMENYLVKQVKEILMEKYHYKLCPIRVYDRDLKPIGIIKIDY